MMTPLWLFCLNHRLAGCGVLLPTGCKRPGDQTLYGMGSKSCIRAGERSDKTDRETRVAAGEIKRYLLPGRHDPGGE